jgi:hypothetical protein
MLCQPYSDADAFNRHLTEADERFGPPQVPAPTTRLTYKPRYAPFRLPPKPKVWARE